MLVKVKLADAYM